MIGDRTCGTCRHLPAVPGNACGVFCGETWSGWSPRDDHNGPPSILAQADLSRARQLFTNEILEAPMDSIDAPLKPRRISLDKPNPFAIPQTAKLPYPMLQVNVETGETWPPKPRGILIALTSPAMGSGKSEAAKALTGEGFEPAKFAGVLKGMTRTFLASGLGLDVETVERMVEGDLKEREIAAIGTTPRYIMQTLGTEWRKLIREDLWTVMLEERLRKMLDKGISVVLDDMRFKVELEMIERLGGFPLRIVRPGAVPTNGHASEGELDGIDMAEIVNDGSLRLLRAKVLDYLDSLRPMPKPPAARPAWAGEGQSYAPWATTH